MTPSRIHAGDVTLVPLQVSDAEEMVAVLADESLYEFTSGEPPTLAELRERYRYQVAGSHEENEVWCNWIVRAIPDGRAIGYVQATVTAGSAEVAWVVGVRDQGRGIAIRAASAMCAWLIDNHVRRIEAHIGSRHTSSQTVATRIGLIRTATVDDEGEEVWASTPDIDDGSRAAGPLTLS